MSYPQYPQGQAYSTTAASEPPLWAPFYGAGPKQAVQRFFAKYATFHGRASRSEYWWWVLANFIVWMVGAILAAALGGAGSNSSSMSPGGLVVSILLFIWFAATIVPNIAVTVRRLHDANLSGWLVLLNLIPYLGGLVVLILTILPPKPEGQRFDRPTAP
ncbi:DUF805 domain-containing protein [Sinomonas humi]|uniref:Membrane protein n=1 Tax=Sinomonas humi TaxID=1338436 RepID=A0A0B2ATG2_9MICC|nr:DUF805 domain-containing protein [Sinomonas humi]KHL05258.1 membrane protein [Sinomonas humi]